DKGNVQDEGLVEARSVCAEEWAQSAAQALAARASGSGPIRGNQFGPRGVLSSGRAALKLTEPESQVDGSREDQAGEAQCLQRKRRRQTRPLCLLSVMPEGLPRQNS